MGDLVIPDVSEFQGAVNHVALVGDLRARWGAAIVIARINYGNSKVDGQADANVDGLREAGADALGWYCYLIGSDDPATDADVFGRVLVAHGGLKSNEFVVCDDEEGSGDQSSRVNAFLDGVDAVLRENQTQDMWYSGLNFVLTHNLEAARGHRWIAAYNTSEPTVAHDLWQFTNSMSFAGVGNCDASIFHGSINDFLSLIGAKSMGIASAASDGDLVALHHLIQDALFGIIDPSGQQAFIDTVKGGTALNAIWDGWAAMPQSQAYTAAKQQLIAVEGAVAHLQSAAPATPGAVDATELQKVLGKLAADQQQVLADLQAAASDPQL